MSSITAYEKDTTACKLKNNQYFEFMKDILADPKKSKDFLEKTGIYDKDGQLTQAYIPNDRTAP